ncbi:hypothetical protein BH11PSE11_BH11PSE11_35460 [soil metagenome]
MDLHQLQLTFHADEDRILLRASFKSKSGELQEMRAWLTRRLIGNMWPGVVRSLESQVRLERPHAAHASAEIVNLEHHASVSEIKAKGNFSTPFESTVGAFPADGAPMLVSAVRFTVNAGKPLRVNFTPAQGSGFEIAFSPTLLHGFCTLLQAAVRSAEWGIDLRLPDTARVDYGARVLN